MRLRSKEERSGRNEMARECPVVNFKVSEQFLLKSVGNKSLSYRSPQTVFSAMILKATREAQDKESGVLCKR